MSDQAEESEKIPICLPCYRQNYSMTENPPRLRTDWFKDQCFMCRRVTNHGIYLPKDEVEAKKERDGWKTG